MASSSDLFGGCYCWFVALWLFCVYVNFVVSVVAFGLFCVVCLCLLWCVIPCIAVLCLICCEFYSGCVGLYSFAFGLGVLVYVFVAVCVGCLLLLVDLGWCVLTCGVAVCLITWFGMMVVVLVISMLLLVVGGY